MPRVYEKYLNNGGVTYKIECRDPDGKLKSLIEYIGKIGNVGHSFSIIVDPDSDNEERFDWDGDGADSIRSIKEI